MGRDVAREINRLTPLGIKSQNKPGRYADGGGLWLQVTPRAQGEGVTKSWLYRYTAPNGKQRQYGIGPFNTVSLADARQAAQDVRKLVHEGIDPIEKRHSERAQARAKANGPETFKDFAVKYIKLNSDGWKNAKHRAQWSSTLETYAYPVIGGLHVRDVTKQHVLQILEPIWESKTETARRVRSRIETVLDMAIAADARETENPARFGVLRFLLPNQGRRPQVRHHPALPYSEIGTFMAQLRNRDDLSASALELLILTACRTSEIIGARWDEIDGNIWAIPAERMKAGREHRVPLTPDALAILDRLPVIDGNPYVFPGQRTKRPLSNMAMLKLMNRMGFGEYTAHGFRSTFRDWAGEQTSYPREVAEAALAHGNPDKIEAAYQRGDFFDKRRKLMEAWAGYCGTVPKTAGNVTPIRKRVG